MGRKGKVSDREKIESISAYINGTTSLLKIADRYCLNVSSVKRWLRKYKTFGMEGLVNPNKNNFYSTMQKEAAVLAYLNGEGSLDSICTKYKIHGQKQLSDWIFKYNGHEKLKATGTGGLSIMTKGRKTSFEERVEIVSYCIAHQNNYSETAQKFQVSYQQVFSWVRKYEDYDVEALRDNRGKRKSEERMSEIEKLKAQNKMLEAENRRKQMEIEFLKKLEEIERRRY
jgi:transposase-like protein